MSAYLRDIGNNVLAYNVIGPQNVTQTTTGATAFDMITGDGRCTAMMNVGLFNATGVTVKFQQSTLTNSGFADITGAAFTQQTTTNTSPQFISFDRDMRYIIPIATVSGTTIAASVVLMEQKKQV